MKSLNLVDLDDVEMIMAVEETFNVSFSDKLLQQCNTVGELFQYLKQVLPRKEIPGKCITSMAFYRLRHALKSIGITAPITPKTPMHTLGDISPFELNRRLSLDTIDTPSFTDHTQLGRYGIGGISFGVIALCFWLFGSTSIGSLWSIGVLLISVSFLAIGTFLYRRDQGLYSYATVGDCAKLTAYSNLPALIKEGAGLREESLWEALCWVIAVQTDADPYKIKLGTTFHEPNIGSIKIW